MTSLISRSQKMFSPKFKLVKPSKQQIIKSQKSMNRSPIDESYIFWLLKYPLKSNNGIWLNNNYRGPGMDRGWLGVLEKLYQ